VNAMWHCKGLIFDRSEHLAVNPGECQLFTELLIYISNSLPELVQSCILAVLGLV